VSVPLETRALGKRFRRGWALHDCSLRLPEGAIVGLAGPNGAGKSTLLELAVALLAPTEGEIRVLGSDPRAEPSVLAEIGYVAQRAPLYRTFTVAETVEFARSTNPRWDDDVARELLGRIPDRRRVSALSAGDRSRLALVLALGKRPSLVLLGEPFARLDPLAAREFLQLPSLAGRRPPHAVRLARCACCVTSRRRRQMGTVPGHGAPGHGRCAECVTFRPGRDVFGSVPAGRGAFLG
jgi:ABC-2 type transport system ATP-binding protein